MTTCFWEDIPKHLDIERHIDEREKLATAIAQTDGKTDAVSVALNRTYRRMRYELGISLAQLEKGKKR